MTGNPIGDSKIRGEDRREPVKFHKQLNEKRVIPFKELKSALKPFEESEFRRYDFFTNDLTKYLFKIENLHWGNPLYETEFIEPEYVISLHYSPWLYAEDDIIINGRMIQDHQINFDNDLHKQQVEQQLENMKYVDKTLEGQEICSITIPKDPNIPDDFSKELNEIQRSMEYS